MADRLDAALADLATAVDFPPTPDLRRSVDARISAAPARRSWLAPLPRALVLALLGLLVVAAVTTAAFLVIPGLRLTFVPSLPAASVAADPLGTRMALGASIDIEDVAAHAPAAVGPPDEAYAIGDDAIVSLVYAASADLPDIDRTGIGLLVQAIEGALERELVNKLVVEVGASVTPVSVNGEPGFWISGPPHLLRYLGPNGEDRAEATRLVGDVLVWQQGGTLYRIESGLGRLATVEMAETIGR
jgi:hypothetical protein